MLKTVARTGALAFALLAMPASAQAAGSLPMLAASQWSLSVMAGFPAGFEAHATDPDGDAVTISWTFDDGTTATGEAPAKVWDAPGTHTATVTATDATGLTYVRVSGPTARQLRRRASVPVVVAVAVQDAQPQTTTRTLKLRTH
jgi:hypothetical protein